jgi:hypothetical protein
VRLLALSPLLLVAACGNSVSCPTGFVGDKSLPPEAIAVYTDGTDLTYHDLPDHFALPVEPPPQGGYVMYVGARVKNMNGCGVVFSGRLLDPQTMQEIGFDGRSSNLVLGADGYGYPAANLSNVSNVNACPQVLGKDVQGQPYLLELTVTDKDGRSVKITKDIVPTCMQSDPRVQQHCICTCSANYAPGKCGFDAGVPGP